MTGSATPTDGRRTQRSLTLGVGIPKDPSILADFSRRAEELGFHGLWAQDTLTKQFSLDGLHALSFAAAVTSRVELGISVLYSGYRHPAVLARELATIDQLSRGRLVVGMGVGNAYHRPKLDALGIPTRPPAARLVEGIGVMRALWSQEEASYDGELYSFSDIESQPKPVQIPGPPIWIGARSEAALARAVEVGDGWTGAGPVGNEEFLAELETVRRELDRHDRAPDTFTVSKNVYVAVEDTRKTARKYMAPFFEKIYGANPVYSSDGMVDRVGVFGTAEQCAEQLQALVRSGVNHLVLHSVYSPADQLEGLAGIVSEMTVGK